MWNRFIKMDNDGLNKQIFLNDVDLCRNNWAEDFKNTCDELDLDVIF